MWPTALFAYTFLVPATLALDISSHLSTSTTLLCSTLYSSSVLLGPLPTTTSPLQQTLDLSPVVLHNYTSHTTTITPKPFSTLFSVLATKTKVIEAEATNGTFYITETRFGTSTFWEHATTTKTETKTRLLTTRTTRWIDAPTGFVGVRNGTVSAASAGAGAAVSSVSNQKRKHNRSAGAPKHPHSKRQDKPSPKPKLLKPTAGKHAVEVACEQHIAVHTTEALLLTASKTATITLKPETVFKNRTVYGTITSTLLVSGSGSSASNTPLSSFATTPSPAKQKKKEKRGKLAFSITTTHQYPSRAPLAAIAMAAISQSSSSAIVTNYTTITKTPYTISFTWTRTITTTSTQTLHATTTITSYSACATGNLLSQTSNNKRINGISPPLDTSDATRLEETETQTAAQCCERCISRGKDCLWSVWQAEGRESGSCFLTLLVDTSSRQKKSSRDGKEGEEAEEEEQQCPSQNKGHAVFGYSGGNGEVRYVVSNGLCGSLSEA